MLCHSYYLCGHISSFIIHSCPQLVGITEEPLCLHAMQFFSFLQLSVSRATYSILWAREFAVLYKSFHKRITLQLIEAFFFCLPASFAILKAVLYVRKNCRVVSIYCEFFLKNQFLKMVVLRKEIHGTEEILKH